MPNCARVYVDKKITAKGGGDHSRVIDVGPFVANNEQPDFAEARTKASKLLKKDEEINSVVSINVPNPDAHPVV